MSGPRTALGAILTAVFIALGCGEHSGAPNPTPGATSPTERSTDAVPAAATTTAPSSNAATTAAVPPAVTTVPAGGAASAPPLVRSGPQGFRFEIRDIDEALRARMQPSSWRPGCPVDLDDLRYLRLSYRDFTGQANTGELVVHRDAVDAMFHVFAALWTAHYPINSLRLIDDFGGDDATSIAADNTSAFNCRFVAGTTRWSNHAVGLAIDINPIENPWVEGGLTDHTASLPFIDRRAAPGVIIEGDAVTQAFDAVGWGWGGRWGEPLDYQHFSASGS